VQQSNANLRRACRKFILQKAAMKLFQKTGPKGAIS
jgi:hypothetical protein